MAKGHHMHYVSGNLEKLMIYQFDDGGHNELSYVENRIMVEKYYAGVMTFL